MLCVSRVTAPACFRVMSSFTKKEARTVLRKLETRLLYFSFKLKTLQEFFKKEIEKLVSKETVASRC